MRIGYSVEDSTSRALLAGLQTRWCPKALLVEGRFRGSTKTSRRREIPKICRELSVKGCDLIVMLTDSNDDHPNAWREVLRLEQSRLPPEFGHLVVVGVCHRNIECWLCADPDWMTARTRAPREAFGAADPKGAFERALSVSCRDRKEREIAELVREAPLRNWLRNGSFEAFYQELWLKSKHLDCQLENLRESGHA